MFSYLTIVQYLQENVLGISVRFFNLVGKYNATSMAFDGPT